ncbi:MAG: hypothetical protein M9934_03840 [Thermomicrobiales bacterium]|nr:hypothetical protein [Thermomicrobiales bacterium]
MSSRKMFSSKGAYQAYDRREITLMDFVGHSHSDVWGTKIYQLWGIGVMKNSGMRQPKERATHPVNSAVHRGPDGIWGSESLKIEHWEYTSARVVIDQALADDIGMDIPVLRRSSAKWETMKRDHPKDVKYIDNPELWIANRFFAGPDPREGKQGTWIVLARDGDTVVRIAIGPSRSSGGYSLATVYATRDDKEIRRWKRHMRIDGE